MTEELPNEWTRGIICPIYKHKGARDDPANYRMICLLSHSYKIFAVILVQRIQKVTEATIRDSQNGFRPQRGCCDNLYILRVVLDDIINTGRTAICVFVDFHAAFDSVDHGYMLNSLREHNVPTKLVNIVNAIYRQAKACVRGRTGHSRDVPINREVLQGDCLSPICFITILDSVLQRCEGNGIMMGKISLEDLGYADDLGMLENTVENATAKLQSLNQQSMSAGMEINVGKTKAMHIMKKERVTTTTTQDVKEMNFQHPCPNCGREFPTAHGMKIHMARAKAHWLTKRSRR